MGIMDKLFGGSDPGTPSNAAPSPIASGNQGPTINNPGVGGSQASASVAATVANNNATDIKETPPIPGDSQLANFADMWQTPTDKDGKPVALPSDPLASDIFNFDPTKIKASAASLDFVKDIKPELLEGLVANGTLNTAALLEILNTVQQNAFAAATLSTGNLVNKAFKQHNANLSTALPSRIRAAQLADTPLGENPVLSHPAVQPLVNALRTTAFSKNPNANPADVAKQVENYLIGLTEAIQANDPKAVKKQQDTAAATTNWGSFFDV